MGQPVARRGMAWHRNHLIGTILLEVQVRDQMLDQLIRVLYVGAQAWHRARILIDDAELAVCPSAPNLHPFQSLSQHCGYKTF